MSALTLPTLETLEATIEAVWKSYRPSAAFSKYSDLWLFKKIVGRLAWRMHQTLARALDAVFPTTTYGIYLDAWLRLVGCSDGAGGYGRYEAAASSGTDALTVTATGAATVSIGDQLTDSSGRTYQLTEGNVFGGAGSANLSVEAISTGSATNLETGDTLTFVSPPANITETATLVLDLDGGRDRETDAAGRQRLLEKLQTPSLSGNWADWVETIEAVDPGNLRAFVWPARQNQPTGFNCVDYCAIQEGEVGADQHIAAVDSYYTQIAAAITARMPVLMMRNSRQLTLTTTEKSICAVITLADSAGASDQCDWDAYSLKCHVDAENSGTKTVTASDDVYDGTTSMLQSGDRVLIHNQFAVVDSVNVGSNPKVFTLTTWPWSDSIVDCLICSGGGTIEDAHDALYGSAGLYESLGPAKGTYAAPITAWEDTLRVLAIQTAIVDAGNETIVDVALESPGITADYSPTAGSGATTARVIPGDIDIFEDKP